MHYTTATLAATLLGLASAQSVHVVSVGVAGSTETAFSPNSVTAQAGEMIQFQFRGGNHSVVQSDFDNPCMPISMSAGEPGIYSGYMPVEASEGMGMIPTWTIMVNNTEPMWLYCSAGTHCQGGMVMGVNVDTSSNGTKTLDAYKAAAATAEENIGGDGVTSGTLDEAAGGNEGGAGGEDGGAAGGEGDQASPSGTPGSGNTPTAGAEGAQGTPGSTANKIVSPSTGWAALAGLAAAAAFAL